MVTWCDERLSKFFVDESFTDSGLKREKLRIIIPKNKRYLTLSAFSDFGLKQLEVEFPLYNLNSHRKLT